MGSGRGRDSEDGEEEGDEDLEVPKGAAKSRAGQPKGSALLASTIDQFVEEQERTRKEELQLKKSQHEQSMVEAREAREEGRQQHREKMQLEHRKLAIDEERVRKDNNTERRLDRIEAGMGQILDAVKKRINK
ncbi:hypothetical protein A4X09_0g7161 [Tilletia walkeri]|uniref:Uncharacterized protein n=1 Tax=Tilletia walkeri TaxID=117179 RepID=A0A8X7N2E8_9BASI|nr:hypothetical protein A4X09_0g7161 [Tilletia walkeri]